MGQLDAGQSVSGETAPEQSGSDLPVFGNNQSGRTYLGQVDLVQAVVQAHVFLVCFAVVTTGSAEVVIGFVVLGFTVVDLDAAVVFTVVFACEAVVFWVVDIVVVVVVFKVDVCFFAVLTVVLAGAVVFGAVVVTSFALVVTVELLSPGIYAPSDKLLDTAKNCDQ